VYDGECSQGDSPGKSIPQLLTCAQDSNKIIKLMQPFILTLRSSDNFVGEKIPCCGQAMAEMYGLLFKPLPIGHHTITVEMIRVLLQPNQPVDLFDQPVGL
jgi:hypothetical protein